MIQYQLKSKVAEPTTFNMALALPKIIFMGTPDFAVSSLDALIRSGFTIAAVVTAPDKPSGRGLKMSESAVKKYAVEKGIPILQPEKLKNPEFIEALKSIQADIQVVVAFRMLPEVVWSMPPKGTINLHASLLPQYRGAAPINWAVINGENETGVTTFRLQQEIDTGNILLQETMAIAPEETAGELHDRMKEIGANVLAATVRGLFEGILKDRPQNVIDADTSLKLAPKINSDTCKIDWTKTTDEVYNLIRGLSPYPTAFTTLDNMILKVFSCEKDLSTNNDPAGTHTTDGKTFLKFATSDGYISLEEIQLQGKKKMKIEEFLRGYRFK